MGCRISRLWGRFEGTSSLPLSYQGSIAVVRGYLVEGVKRSCGEYGVLRALRWRQTSWQRLLVATGSLICVLGPFVVSSACGCLRLSGLTGPGRGAEESRGRAVCSLDCWVRTRTGVWEEASLGAEKLLSRRFQVCPLQETFPHSETWLASRGRSESVSGFPSTVSVYVNLANLVPQWIPVLGDREKERRGETEGGSRAAHSTSVSDLVLKC